MEQPYREEHFLLEAEGYQLPAALTLPQEQPIQWSILLMPGSMSNDVDGNYPGTPLRPHLYADLARQLASRGHAVLRYAKYGEGTGAKIVDEQQTRRHGIFARQRYIAEAAASQLRTRIPQARGLALAGHSEGSVHSMLIARQSTPGVDALISLSGPALRYMDLFIHKAQQMAQEQGEIIDFGAFKVNAAHYIQAFELLRAGKPFTEEIKADPTMAFFVQNWDPANPQGQDGRQYMRDYDAIDPRREIARVPCPVLIIQGGMDDSGVHADNGELLYQARHSVDPATTRLAFFPDLQHFYKRVAPSTNPQDSLAMDEETDGRVGETIDTWLSELESHH